MICIVWKCTPNYVPFFLIMCLFFFFLFFFLCCEAPVQLAGGTTPQRIRFGIEPGTKAIQALRSLPSVRWDHIPGHYVSF